MPLAGGAALVNTGACTMVIEKFCSALGNTPLDAVSVPLKVPHAVGVPEITPAAVIVKPVGRPVTAKVGDGLPLATDAWLYGVPTLPVAGGMLLVNSGASRMVMENAWVASGCKPLDALIVPLKAPTTLGVPWISPSASSVRPVGNPPDVTAKLIVALPDATTMWL